MGSTSPNSVSLQVSYFAFMRVFFLCIPNALEFHNGMCGYHHVWNCLDSKVLDIFPLRGIVLMGSFLQGDRTQSLDQMEMFRSCGLVNHLKTLLNNDKI